MKIVEFWIVEKVAFEEDYSNSKVMIFKSYENAIDYCRDQLRSWDGDITCEQCDDEDGYFRTLVYDSDKVDNDGLWFIIHKGSITIE